MSETRITMMNETKQQAKLIVQVYKNELYAELSTIIDGGFVINSVIRVSPFWKGNNGDFADYMVIYTWKEVRNEQETERN